MLLQLKETYASFLLLGEPTPEPTEAQITEIQFAGGQAEDGRFIDVGNEIAAGSPSVFTVIGFESMPYGVPWMVRWYRNDEFYDSVSEDEWNRGRAGLTWIKLTGSPVPAGEYDTEVYVAGNLLASASFEVAAGDVVAMEQYVSSFFKIAINHPTEWVVYEDPTEAGYLYIAPPTDESRYIWYKSLPWEDDSNDSLLAAILSLWYSRFPDLTYADQGEFFLGGLSQAAFLPVQYTDGNGDLLSAVLVATVDHTGIAHVLVMQAPADEFDDIYSTVFDPILRGLDIER